MRTALWVAACVLWAASAGAQAPGSDPRVDGQDGAADADVIINEIDSDGYPDMRIFATVLRDGRPVTGLSAADFRVREEEVDQQPLTVDPQLPPLSIVMALDSSGSMAPDMAQVQAAARQFVAMLDQGDSVQVISFARDIDTLTPMTSTREATIEAIDGLTARGDTALYDALSLSVDLLADRRGRRAVVLLSDGVDDDGTGHPLSQSTVDDVLDSATDIGVPVFVVGLGTEMDEATLTGIADTTGALYLHAPNAEELRQVYQQLADQLSGQYSIRYTSSLPADGGTRRVDLSALGRQDSRTYAPEGGMAAAEQPAPPPVAADTAMACAALEAARSEQADLEQALDRHRQALISTSDRNMLRDAAVDRLEDAFASPPGDLACVRDTLVMVRDFHAAGLIPTSARNGLRQVLAGHIPDACARRSSPDGVAECLAQVRDAHSEGLMATSTRNDLRATIFDQLLAMMLEAPDFDRDMPLVEALFREGAIATSDRNRARERLLAAEP